MWMMPFWKVSQGFIVNHGLLNMFCFGLLIHLLLVLLLLYFSPLCLVSCSFHLPLFLLLLLQFSQVSDFLIMINWPLCIIL